MIFSKTLCKTGHLTINNRVLFHNCGALRDLLTFVQYKKREKHPWRSANFSKVTGLTPATLLKLTFLHGCFSRFLNCTNSTESRKAPQIINKSTLARAIYVRNSNLFLRELMLI